MVRWSEDGASEDGRPETGDRHTAEWCLRTVRTVFTIGMTILVGWQPAGRPAGKARSVSRGEDNQMSVGPRNRGIGKWLVIIVGALGISFLAMWFAVGVSKSRLAVVLLPPNSVSRNGSTVVVVAVAKGEEDANEAIYIAVDLETGKSLAARRLTLYASVNVGPTGRHFVLRTKDALECFRSADMKSLWRFQDAATHCVWTPDGKALVCALKGEQEDRWSITAFDLEGTRRILLRQTTSRPVRSLEYDGADAVILASNIEEAQPLTLIDLQGNILKRFGPPLPTGRILVASSLDLIAWQPFEGVPARVARLAEGRWTIEQLPLPPKPKDAVYLRLHHMGEKALFLEANSARFPLKAWRGDWTGKFVELNWPRTRDEQAFLRPLPDGKHVVRTRGTSVQVIDPEAGIVVREFKVALPADFK